MEYTVTRRFTASSNSMTAVSKLFSGSTIKSITKGSLLTNAMTMRLRPATFILRSAVASRENLRATTFVLSDERVLGRNSDR